MTCDRPLTVFIVLIPGEVDLTNFRIVVVKPPNTYRLGAQLAQKLIVFGIEVPRAFSNTLQEISPAGSTARGAAQKVKTTEFGRCAPRLPKDLLNNRCAHAEPHKADRVEIVILEPLPQLIASLLSNFLRARNISPGGRPAVMANIAAVSIISELAKPCSG